MSYLQGSWLTRLQALLMPDMPVIRLASLEGPELGSVRSFLLQCLPEIFCFSYVYKHLLVPQVE